MTCSGQLRNGTRLNYATRSRWDKHRPLLARIYAKSRGRMSFSPEAPVPALYGSDIPKLMARDKVAFC